MKLSKIFLLFGACFLLFIIFASPAWADCDINDCLWPEHGQTGTCKEESVLDCDTGRKKCVGNSWVDTSEDLKDLCSVTYALLGGTSSLSNFQEVLVECAETGTTYLECFTGGAEQMQFGAATGVIPNTVNSVSTMILGPVNPEYAAMAPPGALNTAGNLIAGLYGNPPVSSVEYFADLGRNLGIVQPAYAQGVGFRGLSPVLSLWRKFRNIAYIFFVIAFVIVGFAIMFRLKIDPQTVINVQNALPRIIMALILVTFSYAIAGLLIDLIYVFINLILALMGYAPEGYVTQNFFELASSLFTGGFAKVATNLGSQIDTLVRSLIPSTLGGRIFGFSVGLLATAIFAIAICFSLFRLFFSLLISYISIILGVIFAPLMLMLEALPGQRGFSNWLKLMLSNIIVFPVTAGIFAIAAVLTRGAGAATGRIWVAPFLGAGETPAYIPTLIGAGIILLAPTIVNSVKKAVGAPGVAGLAAGIAAPIGAAAGVAAAPVRTIVQPITREAREAYGEAAARRMPGMRRVYEWRARERERTGERG